MLLEIEGLHARYGDLEVLRGIGLSVEHRSITAVIGANGAGKTTLLRAISGLVTRRGKIALDGERIDAFSSEKVAQRGVSHVPEGRGTLQSLTVDENLRLAAHRLPSRAEAARGMERMFAYFPKLAERLHQPAGTLSGGEQQMLAFCRALISRPKLLMLDEPSFGLAPVVVQFIFDILARLRREEDVAVLLIEQNVDLVLDVADRCFVLETGAVVMQGSAAELRANDDIRKTYLGM